MKAAIGIGAAAAIAVAVFVAMSVGQRPAAQQDFKCEPTENNIEGPYYKAGAPAWQQLPSEMPGIKLALTGKVIDQDC